MSRKILFVLAIIVFIIFTISFILPKNYTVERELVINLPIDSVFNYIKLIESQKEYTSWYKESSDFKITEKGEDGTKGYLYLWESFDGKEAGEKEILSMVQNQKVEFEERYYEPFRATNPSYLKTKSLDSLSTMVTWGITGHVPIPLNIIIKFMDMETDIGLQLDKNLKKLKETLEN